MKPVGLLAGPAPSSSAAGVLALLDEEDDNLKLYALQHLDRFVHDFWFQISGSIAGIEALYEDEEFSHRELAALVASKVFYHLDDLSDALTYALGAGKLFDVTDASEYVQTILARCIDTYIEQRVKASEEGRGDDDDGIDPRLTAVMERLFDRCFADGQFEQAVGIALEARRLDRLQGVVAASGDPVRTLTYALGVTQRLIVSRSFRQQVLRIIVAQYEGVPKPDHAAICQCLASLGDADEVCRLLATLLRGSEEEALLAYQIGFDLVDAQMQDFMARVTKGLDAAFAPPPAPAEAPAGGEEVQAMETEGGEAEAEAPAAAAAAPAPAPTGEAPAAEASSAVSRYSRFRSIVCGDVPIELERQFLARRCASDLQILKNIRSGVETRNSVCHGATVFANTIMHCGTTVDTFLRENLDWLARATNWAKFSATAGLGAIHRGNLGASRALMSPYLPAQPGGSTSSAFSEGGALYALGLIHVNHGGPVRSLLLESLRATQHEVIQHGACLGLGISALGTEDGEAFEDVKNVLYTDNAVAGEAAGLTLGLLFAGTGSERCAEMLAYARDTQHEKIIRGLAVGAALVHYGREEAADTVIEQMALDQDPVVRYGGMHAVGLAYCGTSNNAAVQKLLHFAVSDVSDDVRRAAVTCLGFVLASHPEQCPRIVRLLAESYNPHVRYGAAMAVGIAAAGTGLREAVALLEPMLKDSADFVQQGALMALAMVLVEQPEARQRPLRERIDALHSNRGAETLTRMGAIMAAGILDAGGRNAGLSLRARSGHFRRTAVVGMAMFLQYWYWYPLSYALSLCVHPTALIAVDASLGAPQDFAATCNAKASTFAYPAPVAVEDKKFKGKLPTAVLSTTARAKARAAKKAATKDTPAPAEGAEAMDTDAKEGVAKEDDSDAKEAPKVPAEEEPASFELDNASRVVPSQRRFVAFKPDQRFRPVRPAPSGFVVLRDTQPEAGPVEYLFQEEKQKAAEAAAAAAAAAEAEGAAAAAAPPAAAAETLPGGAGDGDEPPPPEPFEYVPS